MKTVAAELPKPEEVSPADILQQYNSGHIRLVCVLGPTASGKTRYAVQLARQLGGEIISADSRQIFRGMDIGTGKDLADYEEVPYHLIDILPAGAEYSVYQFQQDFHRAWEDIRSRGKVPILCGGTGLYISAVTRGYNWGGEKRPLSQMDSAEDKACPDCFFIGTLVSREERNRRIDARLDQRLQEGLPQEIKTLLRSGVSRDRLISYGLEYKYVTEYVLGQRSYEDMREKLAIAIHQFAKRQMTWFRGMERSGVKIHWVQV